MRRFCRQSNFAVLPASDPLIQGAPVTASAHAPGPEPRIPPPGALLGLAEGHRAPVEVLNLSRPRLRSAGSFTERLATYPDRAGGS